MRENAEKRFKRDRETYTDEEMARVKSLYQKASKKWGTDEMRAGLQKLIDEFPGTNRAGCAVLYLAQWEKGEKDTAQKLFDEIREGYPKSVDHSGKLLVDLIE